MNYMDSVIYSRMETQVSPLEMLRHIWNWVKSILADGNGHMTPGWWWMSYLSG